MDCLNLFSNVDTSNTYFPIKVEKGITSTNLVKYLVVVMVKQWISNDFRYIFPMMPSPDLTNGQKSYIGYKDFVGTYIKFA